MALDLGTLVGYLMMDTSKYDDPLDKSSKKTEDFSINAPAWMGAASAAIIAAAVLAGTALFTLGGNFDEVSDGFAIKTTATGAEFQGLVDSADNVASKVPASFDKVGDTLATFNTRMGLSGTLLETVGQQVLEAGRMLGEDINLNAATGALNAFHIEGDDVSKSLDLLFGLTQSTGIGMNDLIGSLQSAAPITQQLGFNFADTAALIGTMDKAGLDSQTMIGAMQRGLVNLTQPGESAQDAFKRVTGEIEGFIASGDKASAIDLAAQVFGTRGAGQFIGALESGNLKLNDLIGSAGLSGDTILEVSERTKDFGENWQIFVNDAMIALKPIATEVFSFLSDVMLEVKDNAKQAFAWISENHELIKNVGIAVGAFAAAFLVLNGAIAAYNIVRGVMTAVTEAGTVAQWLANVAMAANPVGLIVLAISLLIAAIVFLILNWDTVIKFLGDTWNGFVGWFTGVLEGFAGWWNGVWAGFLGFVKDTWDGFIGWIVDTWSGFVGFLKDTWDGFVGWFIGILLGWAGFWRDTWNNVSSFISGVWFNITTGVTGAWNGILDFLGGIPNAILGFFAGAGQWLFKIGQDLINGLWRGIQNIWDGLVGFIQDIGQNIADTFAGVLGIHSPSTVFRAFGINIGEGLIEGLSNVQPEIDQNINSMVTTPTYDTNHGSMGSSDNRRYGGNKTVIMEAKRSTLDEEAIFDALGSPRLD